MRNTGCTMAGFNFTLILSLVFFSSICLAQVWDPYDNPFEKALEWAKKNPDLVATSWKAAFPRQLQQQGEALKIALKLEDDSWRCTLCRVAAGILKDMSVSNDWPELEEGFTKLCEDLLSIVGMRGDVMCPVVRLQGTHIYRIMRAQNTTEFAACENLNLCVPLAPTFKSPKKDASLNIVHHQGHRHAAMHKQGSKRIRKGLRSDKPIRIVQITDIHIEPKYDVGSMDKSCGVFVCCRLKYGTGDAGEYGAYRCNIPVRTLEVFLDKVAEMDADFVIYSGDTPPHSMWEETYESQLNCTGRVIELLHKKLPGKLVFPNIGNHEMYPTNLYSLGLQPTVSMNRQFADWWTPFTNWTEAEKNNSRYAGFYKVQVKPGLWILSYNTNFMYKMNFYNVWNLHLPEYSAMQTFMTNALRTARENGDKVIVIGHHPIGNEIIRADRWLRQVLSDYSDVIALHVAGHTHADEYRVVTDPDSGEPKSVNLVAPSMTSMTNVNPSLRLFTMDQDTFEVRNFEQYHMDLEKTLRTNQPPEIELSYSAQEEYGLAGITAAAFYDLADRMEQDDALLQKYHLNRKAKVLNTVCDESCKREYLCAIRHAVADERRECNRGVRLRDTALGPRAPPTTAIAATAHVHIALWLLAAVAAVMQL